METANPTHITAAKPDRYRLSDDARTWLEDLEAVVCADEQGQVPDFDAEENPVPSPSPATGEVMALTRPVHIPFDIIGATTRLPHNTPAWTRTELANANRLIEAAEEQRVLNGPHAYVWLFADDWLSDGPVTHVQVILPGWLTGRGALVSSPVPVEDLSAGSHGIDVALRVLQTVVQEANGVLDDLDTELNRPGHWFGLLQRVLTRLRAARRPRGRARRQ